MSKRPHRKHDPATPFPDQIAAVRRLAHEDDLPLARQRLAALRQSFPAFKPLLALAWEIEYECGSVMLAAARAFEWQRASPNSRPALQALCDSAEEAGLFALHARTAAWLDPHFAPPPEVETPVGKLSLEQAEAIDLSRMHLADDDPAAAIAAVQDIDHPSARNNLGLALFAGGDVRAARRVMETNWAADPANLFAREWALRCRCWHEGRAACQEFAPPLRDTPARRAEDAVARIAALHFLDDPESARRAWAEAERAPFWAGAGEDLNDVFDTLRGPPEDFAENAKKWFPLKWLHRMTATAKQDRRTTQPGADSAWTEGLVDCDAHPEYLERAAYLADPLGRVLAIAVLRNRAGRGDASARAALLDVIKRPSGSDAERHELLEWLVAQGLRGRGELTEIWLEGELRMVRTLEPRSITAEPRPSPFPPEGTALNEQMHAAIRRGELQHAHALAEQIRALYPAQPMALGNLAGLKEGLGHPAAEVKALYERAHALAPDYLFARCGLARCLAAEGAIEQGRALLEGLLASREEWHATEYRSLLLAQRELARAAGEKNMVRALERQLVQLQANFSE